MDAERAGQLFRSIRTGVVGQNNIIDDIPGNFIVSPLQRQRSVIGRQYYRNFFACEHKRRPASGECSTGRAANADGVHELYALAKSDTLGEIAQEVDEATAYL